MSWAQTWESDHTLYENPPEKVDVFTTSTPERPYKELGIIEASHGGKLSTLIAAMRKFAGERGCDALIVTGSAPWHLRHALSGLLRPLPVGRAR